jgi:multiple sugar transport system permease protein
VPRLVSKLLRAVAVTLIVVWSTFPVLYIVASSFRVPRDILVFPPPLDPHLTLDNYFDLIRNYPGFLGYMANSLSIAVLATVLCVVSAACAGYVYSRVSGRFAAMSGLALIIVRLLPPLVVTIPLFPMANTLGLMDTQIVLVLLYATFWVSMSVFVMKAFIDQIPYDVDEAATIDGATEMQVLRRIIMPLSVQGMVACAVFVFVFSWNEYLYAFIFTTQNAKTTPLVLSEIMDSVAGTNFGVLFAAATVQLVPVVLVVLLLQRWIVAGLTAGAVKA